MLFVWLNVKLKKIDCDGLFIRVPFSSPGGVVLHCPRRTGVPRGGRGPRAAWSLLSLPCAEGGLRELRRLSDPPPHNPIGLRHYFPYWADFLNLESKKSLWLVQSSTAVSSAQFCLQSLTSSSDWRGAGGEEMGQTRGATVPCNFVCPTVCK